MRTSVEALAKTLFITQERKTNNCGSTFQDCFHYSRRKVTGSKKITYRPSSNHKQCPVGISGRYRTTPLAPYRKPQFVHFGGSIVARPKLKVIDGRAPPWLQPVAQFDSTREKLPGPHIVRIDRFISLSWFYRWLWGPFLLGGVICVLNSVNQGDLNRVNSHAILDS